MGKSGQLVDPVQTHDLQEEVEEKSSRQRASLRQDEPQSSDYVQADKSQSSGHEEDLQHTGVSLNDKDDDVIPSALWGCCKSMLAREWAGLRSELKVQVLIWNSLPRQTMAGGTAMGVMVKGSNQEYMHRTLKSIIDAAAAEPMLAAKTMECALQQPGWNGMKLSSAMERAIGCVLKAKRCSEYLQELPERMLSTGRTAVTSMKDRSFLEVGEIHALIAGASLQRDDLRLVRQAFLLPEGNADKSAAAAAAGPKNQPRPPLKGLQLTSFKVRVKNTFLEVHDDDDDDDRADDDDTQSHHSPSSAATSFWSARSEAHESDLDI